MATEDPIGTLVTSHQSGDREALDELCQCFQSQLEHHIQSCMGWKVLQRLDADDVRQEGFTCAFELLTRPRFKDEAPLCRYLAGITEHVIWIATGRCIWEVLVDKNHPIDMQAEAGYPTDGKEGAWLLFVG